MENFRGTKTDFLKAMKKEMYKNDHVSVTYYPKREYSKPYIAIADINDINWYSGYTRKVRGIDKAWQFIEQIFNNYELKDDLKFEDIRKILDVKFNLNVHTYCALD